MPWRGRRPEKSPGVQCCRRAKSFYGKVNEQHAHNTGELAFTGIPAGSLDESGRVG